MPDLTIRRDAAPAPSDPPPELTPEPRAAPAGAVPLEPLPDRPLIVSLDPSTGEPIGSVACDGPDGVDRAVAAASAVQTVWRGSTFDTRTAALRRLADRLAEQAEDVARLVAREEGKPALEALTLEVLPALDHLRYLAENAERLTTNLGIDPREPLYAHKRSYFLHDPVGVVALFTPFNLPFAVPVVQIAAALVMGNAVVLKPSEHTPFCAERILALLAEAGFPHGLVSIVHAAGEDALFLAAHPGVGKIFFTGTRDTARLVVAGAGWSPRPIVLSLGGKHPAIVAADADLDRAARGIVWGAFANCGQNCGAVERVFVERAVAARFVDRVVSETDRLRVGSGLGPGTEIGPLVSDARRREVHAQVSEAVAAGAHRLRGGTVPEGPGFFYPPTVLLDPPRDCRLMREETLGPVLPIVVVDNLEQALLFANDSEYALTASGWTGSHAIAERLIEGLQAGVVTINDVLYSFGEPAATWSGFKSSGVGQNHGAAGLREMCLPKFVSNDDHAADGPVFGFPYDAASVHAATNAVRALHGRSRWTRLRALAKLLASKRFRSRVSLRSFLPAWKRET